MSYVSKGQRITATRENIQQRQIDNLEKSFNAKFNKYNYGKFADELDYAFTVRAIQDVNDAPNIFDIYINTNNNLSNMVYFNDDWIDYCSLDSTAKLDKHIDLGTSYFEWVKKADLSTDKSININIFGEKISSETSSDTNTENKGDGDGNNDGDLTAPDIDVPDLPDTPDITTPDLPDTPDLKTFSNENNLTVETSSDISGDTQYKNVYFTFDDKSLIPENNELIKTLPIAFINNKNYKIRQHQAGPIYLGSGSGETASSTDPMCYEVRKNGGKWQVFSPRWIILSPELISLTVTPTPTNIDTQLFGWQDIPDLTEPTEKSVVKTSIDNAGKITLKYLNTDDLSVSSTEIRLGYFTDNKFVQEHIGAIISYWEKSKDYWNVDDILQNDEPKDPTITGQTISKDIYWQLTTFDGFSEIEPWDRKQLISKNYYQWINPIAYNGSEQLVKMKPVLLPTEEILPIAQWVDQPFVENLTVTYPDSPLNQGSVDQNNKSVKVLVGMNGVQDLPQTNLFLTETIDVSENTPHETEEPCA